MLRKMIKRPCRVCGRWYTPNARSRGHQKTCDEAACKKQWHKKKCEEWNNKNRPYFNARYLSRKLHTVVAEGDFKKAVKDNSPHKPQLPSTTANYYRQTEMSSCNINLIKAREREPA